MWGIGMQKMPKNPHVFCNQKFYDLACTVIRIYSIDIHLTVHFTQKQPHLDMMQQNLCQTM